jgi:hypothetical protein
MAIAMPPGVVPALHARFLPPPLAALAPCTDTGRELEGRLRERSQ